jgi:hypothetical protein
MTTRSWIRRLLTTVLARLTRRDTSTVRPQLGWNGRPLVGTQDNLSSGSMPPATDCSTLIAYLLQDGGERACAETPRSPS